MTVVLPSLIVTFSAVDVPDDVQREVFRLLTPYDVDVNEHVRKTGDSGRADA